MARCILIGNLLKGALGLPSLSDVRRQAVTGVVPPQTAEAKIRVAWPAVTTAVPVAKLGKTLMCTIILAPLAWLLLAPFYFKKILPFAATRYTLTNRRLMIQRGLRPRPVSEIALAEIDEVRIPPESVDTFYRAGTLEIVSKGQVRLTLPGVPGTPHLVMVVITGGHFEVTLGVLVNEWPKSESFISGLASTLVSRVESPTSTPV